ncbi:MAG: proline--tRNA ligase, partial [Candidatus Marinimicrobia bacterium]|nr:proline--tRNA ligase [Candidatus Neomarinimicrobiota bacterium]
GSVEKIVGLVKEKLTVIQQNLFKKALKFREENTFRVSSYDELNEAMERGGFAIGYWAGTLEDERKIQEETKATIRCIPFEQEGEGKCILTGKKTSTLVVFAKSY